MCQVAKSGAQVTFICLAANQVLAHFYPRLTILQLASFPLDNQPPTFDSLEVEVKWEIALVAAKTVGQVSDSFLNVRLYAKSKRPYISYSLVSFISFMKNGVVRDSTSRYCKRMRDMLLPNSYSI
jgi:hypothetical protein